MLTVPCLSSPCKGLQAGLGMLPSITGKVRWAGWRDSTGKLSFLQNTDAAEVH